MIIAVFIAVHSLSTLGSVLVDAFSMVEGRLFLSKET